LDCRATARRNTKNSCEGPGYYRGPVWNELQLESHAGTACDLFDPNVAAAATSTAITTMSARNFMLLLCLRLGALGHP
jgi:hypothetical protein